MNSANELYAIKDPIQSPDADGVIVMTDYKDLFLVFFGGLCVLYVYLDYS